jgi:hypothetical protein
MRTHLNSPPEYDAHNAREAEREERKERVERFGVPSDEDIKAALKAREESSEQQ